MSDTPIIDAITRQCMNMHRRDLKPACVYIGGQTWMQFRKEIRPGELHLGLTGGHARYHGLELIVCHDDRVHVCEAAYVGDE